MYINIPVVSIDCKIKSKFANTNAVVVEWLVLGCMLFTDATVNFHGLYACMVLCTAKHYCTELVYTPPLPQDVITTTNTHPWIQAMHIRNLAVYRSSMSIAAQLHIMYEPVVCVICPVGLGKISSIHDHVQCCTCTYTLETSLPTKGFPYTSATLTFDTMCPQLRAQASIHLCENNHAEYALAIYIHS